MGLESVEELKSKLKEVLETEVSKQNELGLRSSIEKALLQTNAIPVPPSLVAQRLDSMVARLKSKYPPQAKHWSDKENEEIRTRFKPMAEDEIRLSYLYQAVAKKENIEVSDDDIKKELEENLKNAHGKKEQARVKKFFKESSDDVTFLLRERKVFAFLKSKAIQKP